MVARDRGRCQPAPWRCRARLACCVALVLGTVALARAETSGGTTEEQTKFDPWEGIERSGRIPKPERPPELKHPDRWRYIPEGRIKPGNIFQRFLVSSFIAPFVFRDTDVGFGGGVAVTDIDFRQQRRREFAGIFMSYTVEGQQSYDIGWRRWLHHVEAPEGGVFQEERSFLRAAAEYERSLTRRFFGFGADSQERDETSYTDATVGGRFGVQLTIPDPGDDLILGMGVRGEWHNLSGGEVSDEPVTGDVFPGVFDDAKHRSLGWLQADLHWDTRDSQRQPYRGWDVGLSADAAPIQTGWEVGAIFTGSGSYVFPVPALLHRGGDRLEENPPTDTVALIAETQATAGDLPFFALPTLGGGDRLRGFIEGRFRDRSLWFTGAEYRVWILPRGFPIPFTETLRVERAGLAPFVDVGSVAGDWWDLFSARVRWSAGLGLRFTFERAAPFRVDVGFSTEATEVTARFGLPF